MSEKTPIAEKLRQVQVNLKAPKGQYNSFGKYKYRNCEDILEAVKPRLDDAGLTLLISDEVTQIGDRYYVQANAWVTDGENTIEVRAFAREEETKKGMDGAQVTGAASSYARKYALNGLFNIDDTKDADSQDNRKQELQVKPPVVIKVNNLETSKAALNTLLEQNGHENTVQKKLFIQKVLDKSTVDTVQEAETVMRELAGV